MAIEINLPREQNDNLFPYPNAYLRIYDVEIKTTMLNPSEQVWIKINIWADKDSRKSVDDDNISNWASSIKKIVEKTSVATFSQYVKEFTVSGIHAGAYEYIKKLFKYNGKDV